VCRVDGHRAERFLGRKPELRARERRDDREALAERAAGVEVRRESDDRAGIDELLAGVDALASGWLVPSPPGGGPGAPEFESEHRIYRPQGAGGFAVVRADDGVFEVVGRGVEMLVERHDLANPEALGYLERRLHEIGVVKALRDAGFEPGDEVRVGEQAFELE